MDLTAVMKNLNRKKSLISSLTELDDRLLLLALLYAHGLIDFGVDVTKEYNTATANTALVEEAYRRGYDAGFRSGSSGCRLNSLCKACDKFTHV